MSSGVAGEAIRRTRSLELSTHALAFGAQQLLCTVPLIVAISAVMSHSPDRGIGNATITFFGLDGPSAAAVTQLLGRQRSSISPTALVLSMIIALVLSTSVGAVQQRAFELIWNLPPLAGARGYLRQLAWTPTLAAFTVGLLAVARPGRWLDEQLSPVGSWLVAAARVVLISAFYWWSQYWLLARRVAAIRLLPGAIVVGVLAMTLVEASRLVVPGQIDWQVQAYGLVGAGFVFAAWLMILAVVVYVAILFGALIADRRGLG